MVEVVDRSCSKFSRIKGTRIWILVICLVFNTLALNAHVLDELSVKTRLFVKQEGIDFKLELAPGVLIAEPFLKILDPRQTKEISESGRSAFLNHVIRHMVVLVNHNEVSPDCGFTEIPAISELITGVGTIYLDCRIDGPIPKHAGYDFEYRNSLESGVALYSLHISSDRENQVFITEEERDEITQDSIRFSVKHGFEPGDVGHVWQADLLSSQSPVSNSLGDRISDLAGMKSLLRILKMDRFSPAEMALLLVLAAAAGFLHAFTPGHGKALVGAYLVANRGSVVQAVQLGLIVTLTHTASIYLFGGLSLTATYLFLPSRVIPVLTVASGLLVIAIGLYSLIRRGLKLEVDHAHLLPNFQVFGKGNVNILIDGNAAEATEYFSLAAESESVLYSLAAAGAEDITICSTGCDTHHKHWLRILDENQQLGMLKKAVRTGAVDAFVSRDRSRREKIGDLLRKKGGEVFQPPMETDSAERLLVKIVGRFNRKRTVNLPGNEMTWRHLFSLGFAGGVVPCPDALAILLIAVSMAQILSGLMVVFAFSVGLSLALMLTGVLVVSMGNLTIYSRAAGKITTVVPYLTSLFLTGLGCYIVFNAF